MLRAMRSRTRVLVAGRTGTGVPTRPTCDLGSDWRSVSFEQLKSDSLSKGRADALSCSSSPSGWMSRFTCAGQ